MFVSLYHFIHVPCPKLETVGRTIHIDCPLHCWFGSVIHIYSHQPQRYPSTILGIGELITNDNPKFKTLITLSNCSYWG